MLFGIREQFAIETEVVGFTDDGRPLGKLRIWAAGTPVGDFSEVQHLGVADMYFADTVETTGDRIDHCLDRGSPAEIVQLIKSKIYGDDETLTLDEIEQEAKRFNKFVLFPGIEAFDSLFGVLVYIDDEILFIWAPFDDVSQCQHVQMPKDLLLQPMELFHDWYQNQTSVN